MLVRELFSGVVAAIGACIGAALGGIPGFLLGGVGDAVLGAGSLIALGSLAGAVGGSLLGAFLGIYASLRSCHYPVPGLTTVLFALLFLVTASLTMLLILGRSMLFIWLIVVWQYPAVGWALLPISLLTFSLARMGALWHHIWQQRHQDLV